MEELLKGNNILLSKKYSIGSVYLIELSEGMLVVIAIDNKNLPLCSRSFFYNENKKEILKEGRKYFRQIQECLRMKKIELIEELDLF